MGVEKALKEPSEEEKQFSQEKCFQEEEEIPEMNNELINLEGLDPLKPGGQTTTKFHTLNWHMKVSLMTAALWESKDLKKASNDGYVLNIMVFIGREESQNLHWLVIWDWEMRPMESLLI